MAQTPSPRQEATTSPASSRRWLTLAVILVGTFMAILDAFIVNVALPSIQRTIKASPADSGVSSRQLLASLRSLSDYRRKARGHFRQKEDVLARHGGVHCLVCFVRACADAEHPHRLPSCSGLRSGSDVSADPIHNPSNLQRRRSQPGPRTFRWCQRFRGGNGTALRGISDTDKFGGTLLETDFSCQCPNRDRWSNFRLNFSARIKGEAISQIGPTGRSADYRGTRFVCLPSGRGSGYRVAAVDDLSPGALFAIPHLVCNL